VKVAVLMGGHSSEREISLRTGRGIAQALRGLGHDVVALDAANGRLLPPGEEERAPLPAEALQSVGEPLVRLEAMRDAEVVFIALHGAAGENGTLQALLDLAGKPYTGSGMLASALAMNKAMSKRIFEREAIPTPRWALIEEGGLLRAMIRTGAVPPQIERLGWPVVVKPNEEGSSVGLTVVGERSGLEAALREAERYGTETLVEEFIAGREMSVAVLGEQALPVVEIRPKSGLYDYESKYTAGRSEYFCPADVPDDVGARLREIASRAARVLGCRGVSRVDFRLSEAGEPSCLEVNTIPGMTPTSLVPMAAKAVGLSYEQLVGRMLTLAVNEAQRRRPRPTTPR
jgi:D-alanine-D-alanine ligase